MVVSFSMSDGAAALWVGMPAYLEVEHIHNGDHH